MRIVLLFFILSLVLTACRTEDRTFRHQIIGTWTKDTPVNPVSFSWKDPIALTYTFSPDGSYLESVGHRSVPVKFQGTWQLQGNGLVMTVTNAQGTDSYQPAPGQVGKVIHSTIVRVDGHQLILAARGNTNLFTADPAMSLKLIQTNRPPRHETLELIGSPP